MKTSKVRQLVAGTAVTVVLAAAGVGTALALDSEDGRPEPQSPSVDGTVTDAGPNSWAANDCAVLLDVFGEGAQAYGCIERSGPAGPPSQLRSSARTVGAADVDRAVAAAQHSGVGGPRQRDGRPSAGGARRSRAPRRDRRRHSGMALTPAPFVAPKEDGTVPLVPYARNKEQMTMRQTSRWILGVLVLGLSGALRRRGPGRGAGGGSSGAVSQRPPSSPIRARAQCRRLM